MSVFIQYFKLGELMQSVFNSGGPEQRAIMHPPMMRDRRDALPRAGTNTNCPTKKIRKKKKSGADEQEHTNHAERNSGVGQWRASTLARRPSLVTGARTDKFGLSF